MSNEQHLTQEQLVEMYYGAAAEDGHLEQCPQCRSDYRALQQTLNAVSVTVPERGPEYGAAVWAAIAPRLPGRRRRSWWQWLTTSRWMPAAVMAVLLVGAFFAGRYTRPDASPKAGQFRDFTVRERVLRVSVGDYLERSQMVISELANAPDQKPRSIVPEQERAEDLLQENRLYRQTASATGDRDVAAVLDELERVLLTIAHSPQTMSGPQMQELQHRLEEQGLLFKLRVLGSNLSKRGTDLRGI